MGEYFSFEQPARGQYADIFLAGIRQELFQTVGPRKYIVIHAPNPVGTRLISVLYACIESSRTAHIGLIDYCQPFLCGKPFRCTVRASVIYYYNGRYRLVLLQTTNISFQKFHSVVGYNYGYNVHDAFSFSKGYLFSRLYASIGFHELKAFSTSKFRALAYSSAIHRCICGVAGKRSKFLQPVFISMGPMYIRFKSTISIVMPLGVF